MKIIKEILKSLVWTAVFILFFYGIEESYVDTDRAKLLEIKERVFILSSLGKDTSYYNDAIASLEGGVAVGATLFKGLNFWGPVLVLACLFFLEYFPEKGIKLGRKREDETPKKFWKEEEGWID